MRLDPFAHLPAFPEAPSEAPGGQGWYRRLFAIHEIEASPPLQWLSVALLVSFFLTFHEWSRASDITVEAFRAGEHQCWPWFPDCGRTYFLSALPNGYSQTTLYAVLLLACGACALAIWRRSWAVVHGLLLGMFVWKALGVFVLTTRWVTNYNYFHLIFGFLFLFARYKAFFLRRTFVLLYVLAGLVKLSDGWVTGSYFSSLTTGLPLVPRGLIPVATNLVILLEIVGAPLLLSRRFGRVALAAFVLFHVYSTILVAYRYPVMVMGPLLCLFGPRFAAMPSPFTARAAWGWALCTTLLCGQAVAYVIPGDARYTLEGNYYGLFMFEANHQCRSSTRVHTEDGKTRKWRNDDRTHAHNRCDPYAKWFRLRQLCRRPGVKSIEWRFDHSLNGGPLYRIVDVPDACVLDYQPFAHNDWIRGPDQAEAVGLAVENVY